MLSCARSFPVLHPAPSSSSGQGVCDRQRRGKEVGFLPISPHSPPPAPLWKRGLCKAPRPQPARQVPFAQVPASDSPPRRFARSTRSTSVVVALISPAACPVVQAAGEGPRAPRSAVSRALYGHPTHRYVVDCRR